MCSKYIVNLSREFSAVIFIFVHLCLQFITFYDKTGYIYIFAEVLFHVMIYFHKIKCGSMSSFALILRGPNVQATLWWIQKGLGWYR